MRQGVGRVAAFVCALFVSACLENPAVTCKNGLICAPGNVCDDAHGGCATSSQIVACTGKAAEAACTYPGVLDGACYEGVCLPAGCGNGSMAADEVCDDGNRIHGDGCSADCRSNETCGNGILDAFIAEPEQCDDGNTDDSDSCHANCKVPICGDGIKDPQFNEACDDGANNSNAAPDACRPNCQLHFCGDGVTDGNEVCDDGNTEPRDGCFYNCQSDETCGNGHVDFARGEQCEDENSLAHDGCSECRVEQPVWRKAFLGSPTSVDGHAMAYDAAHGRVVMFGGGGTGYSSDTWQWDGGAWTEVNTASASARPPGRMWHAMAYASRGTSVMFGGTTTGGTNGCLADTWLWDGAKWTNATPTSGNPPARMGNAMAYDAGRGKLVMFGGWPAGGGYLDDTWEWNGTTWTEVVPATRPKARGFHAMTYDAVRGKVLMFGGDGIDGIYNDIWEWNGTTWTDVSPASPRPSPRSNNAMIFDAARGKVVMFGGIAWPNGKFGDTWEWNGSAWTNVTPGSSPSARGDHAMAYDIARGRTVLFAGFDYTNYAVLGDTWEWSGSAWANVSPSSAKPTARVDHALSYDVARGTSLLFGGYEYGPGDRDDTWRWNGSIWTNAAPTTKPPARERHAMAYDAARDRMVMFAGQGSSVFADTWEWDGGTWSLRTTTPAFTNASFEAPAVGAASFQYNPSGATWTFTGSAGIQSNGSSWGAPTAPDGTQTAFLQNLGSMSQTVVLPAGTYALEWQWARRGTQYQPIRLRVDGVQVGTPASPFCATGACFTPYTTAEFTVAAGSHTIALEGTNGTGDNSAFVDAIRIHVSGPRGHAMAYDAARSKVVLFGGDPSAPSASNLSVTWQWDGSKWTDVTPASSNAPSTAGYAMAYDAARSKIVMFGAGTGGGSFGETWEWDGSKWAHVIPLSSSPTLRGKLAMTYDASRGRVLLFGGEQSGVRLGDVWEWDGSDWTDVTPSSGGPGACERLEATYDVARAQTVVVGGICNDDAGNTTYLADTWLYRFDHTAPAESCLSGLDGDGDNLVGCADPDCFGYCTPYCNPTIMTCNPAWPHCGDGTCQTVETSLLCPADCGAPTPVCGDFLCHSPETKLSCPGDCSPAQGALAPAVGDLAINEFMAADNMSDTNCDGSTANTHDEFVELVNISNKTLDLNGVTVADSVSVRHTFASTILPPGEAVVLWSGGVPTINGACSKVKRAAVASSGQLGLNDAGDTIKLALGTTTLVTVTYAQATANKSFNLSPEVMPNSAAAPTNYVLHDSVAGAQGTFSPGTLSSGASF